MGRLRKNSRHEKEITKEYWTGRHGHEGEGKINSNKNKKNRICETGMREDTWTGRWQIAPRVIVNKNGSWKLVRFEGWGQSNIKLKSLLMKS